MADVFVSYAREDREKAKLIADVLMAHGYTVWWDINLRGGDQIADIVEKAIRGARAVVVLWSSTSVKSHWVVAEADEARRSQKLVPILCDAAEPPLQFRGIHTVNVAPLINRDDVDSKRDLIESVAQLVALPRLPPQPPIGNNRPGISQSLLSGAALLVALAACGMYLLHGPRIVASGRAQLEFKHNYTAEKPIPLSEPLGKTRRVLLTAGYMKTDYVAMVFYKSASPDAKELTIRAHGLTNALIDDVLDVDWIIVED
jgi:hypothetical protein